MTRSDMAYIGADIKAWCERWQTTQRRLAVVLHRSPYTVHQWAANKSQCTCASLVRFRLMFGPDHPEPAPMPEGANPPPLTEKPANAKSRRPSR